MYKLRIDTCMRIDPNTGFNDAEFIAHSTVRIEVKFANGKSGVGTGFLYEFWSTNQSVVHALVTNKHVL